MSVAPRLNRRWLRLSAVAGVAALVVLSWMPGDLRPSTGGGRTLEHAAPYLVVTAVLALAYAAQRRLLLAGGLVLLAAVLETGQLWVPGREAALRDFLASAAGTLAGVAIMTAVARL